MILHGLEPGMILLNPYFEPTHAFQRSFGDKDADAVEVVGEHAQCLTSLWILLEGWLDVDGPAFDLLLNGVKARLEAPFGIFSRGFLSRGSSPWKETN
jgi:hypothetical protein